MVAIRECLYYFAMPNENEILGYVSSNMTYWKSLQGKGQKPCTTGKVYINVCSSYDTFLNLHWQKHFCQFTYHFIRQKNVSSQYNPFICLMWYRHFLS